uniref:ATP-grasp domain-containing protein n=1 Tax=Ditylenchus dipsaci TaxID=166011 RepID=A0A915CVP7_9BILA
MAGCALFNSDQLAKLEEFNKTKRVVAVLVMWKCPFFTQFEDFHKPDDAALIGIIQEQIRDDTPKCVLEHFDLIIWYKADYSKYEDVLLDWSILDIPTVTQAVAEICEVVEPKKMKLIEMMEHTINLVCNLREKHSIPGPRKEDLEEFLDFSNISSPSDMLKTVSAVCEQMEHEEKENNAFTPIFRKPICGMGSAGSGKIESRQELVHWITEECQEKNKGSYLIEQYIDGREFWAIVCLLPNNNWRPLYIVDFLIGDCLEKGDPITFCSHRFEDAQAQFPNVDKFVGLCIEKIKPPHPHLFCVQGFQVSPGTDNYLFTECSYRMNGARGCGIGYGSAGISLETALISCHIDPNYAADPDPHWQMPRFESQIWWPYKVGTLRSCNEFPEESTVLHKANSLVHFVVRAKVRNCNEQQLRQDVAWIESNWTPDIVDDN